MRERLSVPIRQMLNNEGFILLASIRLKIGLKVLQTKERKKN